MRISLLIPGTGHFHCGSCLRDEALALGLTREGHEVNVTPLYLPLVLEQESRPENQAPVRLGGINMYLQQKLSWAGSLPGFLRDLLDRPGLLRWASRRGNMTDSPDLGPLTLATLRGEAGPLNSLIEQLVSGLAGDKRPDVVMLSNAMLVGLVRGLKAGLPGVRVICTLQGEEPFLDRLPQPYRDQAWAELRSRCADVERFIAVSHWYGARMAGRLDLGSDQMKVVTNGIEVEELGALERRSPAVPTVGFMARLCEDKGVHTLVAAFESLVASGEHPDLRLKLGGALQPEDRGPLAKLRRHLAKTGLSERVDIHPNVTRSEKSAFLASLSVLSVPATYGESFGLYVLEALAAGVPVVQPDHGGLTELVRDTQGGLLYDPEDPAALANTLGSFLRDDEALTQAGERGRAAVLGRYTASRMSTEVGHVCASCLP
ncbi:MAG: glycosyltransferase family 4 protein [Planctomycetota bacterium]|nr:glycosyltransferase family 4 protein [Planctomycetota bacterium]MDP6939195.1 glycosyltransferase family 4 protein [Planctomycetota bacterium]